jgi:hypothetical protein
MCLCPREPCELPSVINPGRSSPARWRQEGWTIFLFAENLKVAVFLLPPAPVGTPCDPSYLWSLAPITHLIWVVISGSKTASQFNQGLTLQILAWRLDY